MLYTEQSGGRNSSKLRCPGDGSSSFKFFIFTVLPDFWNFPLRSVALAIGNHLITITIHDHDHDSRSSFCCLMAVLRFVVRR